MFPVGGAKHPDLALWERNANAVFAKRIPQGKKYITTYIRKTAGRSSIQNRST